MPYTFRKINFYPILLAGTAFLFAMFVLPQSSYAQHRNMEFYISEAAANSPLIKEYRNQILSARIDSQLIRATFKPQINAVSNNYIAPVFNGYGYDEAVTNGATYTGLITVNKAFIGKNNLNTQLRSSTLIIDSTRNSRRITEQDLARTIVAQYITAYGNQQQYFINKEINQLLAQEDLLFKKLTQENVYRQADYLTFLVTYKQQELQLKQSYIQFQSDFANLNYLSGVFDTGSYRAILDAPNIELSILPDPSFSIYFSKYTLDSLRLQNDISIINYSYKPKFSLFGDAGFTSSRLNQLYKTFGFSAGFNLSIPIYDGNKKKLSLEKIKLLEDTRINYRDYFRNQYKQQIAQFRQQLQSTEELVEAINEQIRYTEGLIKVNEKLLQTGDVKISDFIIAINNYLNARSLIMQNTVSRLQIINQVNYWSR